jgi:hypothetical protein
MADLALCHWRQAENRGIPDGSSYSSRQTPLMAESVVERHPAADARLSMPNPSVTALIAAPKGTQGDFLGVGFTSTGRAFPVHLTRSEHHGSDRHADFQPSGLQPTV